MLEPYVWLKWLHVLSSTVLFGTGFGMAYQLWSAHRSRKARPILVVARNVVRADWRFSATSRRRQSFPPQFW